MVIDRSGLTKESILRKSDEIKIEMTLFGSEKQNGYSVDINKDTMFELL